MTLRELTVRGEADLVLARHCAVEVGRALRSWGLAEARCSALEVAVAEVVSNVCRHGYPPGAPGPLEMALRWTEHGLLLRFRDRGRPFDPTREPDPPHADPDEPASWPDGGMGLVLVHAACDALRYRRAGDVNELTLQVDAPAPSAPRAGVRG